jgi:tRNA-splicing ligase RtcB (3'-phosphate/5'-hydroxy nucleic acid ligase)
MDEHLLAPMRSWLVAPMSDEVSKAIWRLRRAPDVQRVAVMPDVHLADDVCVGVAVATTELLYPQAVGGDIGCGMLAIPFEVEAGAISEPGVAGRVLGRLGNLIPARRRNRRAAIPMPAELSQPVLSASRLESLWNTTGILEFATLGSGNHFVELQADQSDRLWLMVHSGSRCLGPEIRDHHLTAGEAVGGGLKCLRAGEDTGAAYLGDAAMARRFAHENRRQIACLVEEAVLGAIGSGHLRWVDAVMTDHNHVEQEIHGASHLWVHRKGAMPAWPGQAAVLPGSMGSLSYHVVGRGCAESLCSSAHGAGRLMSRTEARKTITSRDLQRQMGQVWYDFRQSDRLRDEAPGAYKDIRAVARAQRDLVKVTRVLRPILNYKGT